MRLIWRKTPEGILNNGTSMPTLDTGSSFLSIADMARPNDYTEPMAHNLSVISSPSSGVSVSAGNGSYCKSHFNFSGFCNINDLSHSKCKEREKELCK